VAKTDPSTILTVALNLALDVTAVEVVEALRGEGVRSILLKGPPLVRWLYGSDAARTSVDVDLLVSPENRTKAEQTLSRIGFSRLATSTGEADRPKHASTWNSNQRAPCIDLHTTLVGLKRPAAEVWEILSTHVEPTELRGVRVDVLGPAARTLHVVLHAAQHGAREPQPIEDLAHALETLPPEVWQEAAQFAARLDGGAAFSAGLTLLPRGKEVLDRLGLGADSSVEAALRATTPPPLALGLDWLVRAPGLRAKSRFVARKIVPPRAFMRTWSRLARRGTGGLLLTYLWRPVWLLLRLGPAVRAWRAARGRSRRS
jgi:hypothetical protein